VFFCAVVAGTTFFISLEPGVPSQFPGIGRSTKSWRRKFFAILRVDFLCKQVCGCQSERVRRRFRIRRFHEAAERGDASVSCWGSGSPLREFLHVDDLGEACVFALERWQPAPDALQCLNMGTGVDLSIRELAKAVAALGWRTRIPLADGLASTVTLTRDLPNDARGRSPTHPHPPAAPAEPALCCSH
jgi:GDP-L-fucose synthase